MRRCSISISWRAGLGVVLGCLAIGAGPFPAVAQAAGDEPAALVEEVAGARAGGIEAFDYLYAGQSIDLGRGGTLALTYLASCTHETIRGGRVRIGKERSDVRGGEVDREQIACLGPRTLVTAEASEVGGAVKRIIPFDPEEWFEVALKSDRPIFKWEAGRPGETSLVTVIMLDAAPARIVFQERTSGDHLLYPRDAPPLQAGLPYAVQVIAGGREMAAVFSIDPWLEIADVPANRVVRLEP